MISRATESEKERVMLSCNHILEDSYAVFSHYTKLISYKVPPLRALEQTLCHFMLDITQDDTVLDIGPGYNFFTYYSALRNGCTLDLIDIDTKVVSFHKSIIKKGSFSQITSKKIKHKFPCETGKYNKAFCISTFEHIPNSEYIHFLEEVDRVLQPKGKIVFSFPYASGQSSVRMINTHQFSFPEITFNSYFIEQRISKHLNYSIQNIFYIRPISTNIWTAYTRPYQLENFFEIISLDDKLEKTDINCNKLTTESKLDGVILLVLEKP